MPPGFQKWLLPELRFRSDPDLLIRSAGADGKPRIGAAIFRLARAPGPIGCRLEETRKSRGDHRREMARYMVAMLEMLLDAHADEFGEADRALCFVADIDSESGSEPRPTMSARLRAIRSACDQIARLWSTVRPRSSILAP